MHPRPTLCGVAAPTRPWGGLQWGLADSRVATCWLGRPSAHAHAPRGWGIHTHLLRPRMRLLPLLRRTAPPLLVHAHLLRPCVRLLPLLRRAAALLLLPAHAPLPPLRRPWPWALLRPRQPLRLPRAALPTPLALLHQQLQLAQRESVVLAEVQPHPALRGRHGAIRRVGLRGGGQGCVWRLLVRGCARHAGLGPGVCVAVGGQGVCPPLRPCTHTIHALTPTSPLRPYTHALSPTSTRQPCVCACACHKQQQGRQQ